MLCEQSFIDSGIKVKVKPSVVFRVEKDSWGILIDQATNCGFGLNPLSVLLWKHIDGQNTVKDLEAKIRENCLEVPVEVGTHIKEFIEQLITKGLVTLESC